MAQSKSLWATAVSRLPIIGKPCSTGTCSTHGKGARTNRDGKCCVCCVEGTKARYQRRYSNPQLSFDFGP